MSKPIVSSVVALCLLALACSDGSATFEAPASSVSEPLALPPDVCEDVYVLDYHVPVGDGVQLHVVEKLTARSLLARPRRAVLMLSPTLATNELYAADVPGDASYDALARAAQEGYFALAVSYEGYGQSTQPTDGSTVTAERLLEQLSVLIEWIRVGRMVDAVDLFGMSLGSSLAMALGGDLSPGDPMHVGKIVLASHVYDHVTPFFEQAFLSPELRALLESAPNGYIVTDPGAYAGLMGSAEPAALSWAIATLPGRYATGPTLEGFDLPVFDATYGRAPALQIYGDADPVTPPSDVAVFQSEYGGPASVIVVPGGGHSILLESGRDLMWTEAFRFLDEGRTPAPEVRCEQ